MIMTVKYHQERVIGYQVAEVKRRVKSNGGKKTLLLDIRYANEPRLIAIGKLCH